MGGRKEKRKKARMETKGEGNQESKGESEKEDEDRNERGKVRRWAGLNPACPSLFLTHSLFPSRLLPLPLSPVTMTGPVIGRGPLSLSAFFLFFSLPRGSAPQREPWGPEIADDKIAAAFHSAQGYPTFSLTAEPHLRRKGGGGVGWWWRGVGWVGGVYSSVCLRLKKGKS